MSRLLPHHEVCGQHNTVCKVVQRLRQLIGGIGRRQECGCIASAKRRISFCFQHAVLHCHLHAVCLPQWNKRLQESQQNAVFRKRNFADAFGVVKLIDDQLGPLCIGAPFRQTNRKLSAETYRKPVLAHQQEVHCRVDQQAKQQAADAAHHTTNKDQHHDKHKEPPSDWHFLEKTLKLCGGIRRRLAFHPIHRLRRYRRRRGALRRWRRCLLLRGRRCGGFGRCGIRVQLCAAPHAESHPIL